MPYGSHELCDLSCRGDRRCLERFGGYYTAGLIGITFRVLDVVVLLLLGTDVLVLRMLLLMSVRVRAVVLIRNKFLLPIEQVGLELFIGQDNILF